MSPDRHTKPFLLIDGDTTTKAVPRGWTLTSIGAWGGREAVVGYDPRRYDVIVVSQQIDNQTAHELFECGFRRQAGAPTAWQARLNRRIIHEGTWHECAAHAHDAIAYAHNHESRYGTTTSEGMEALLNLGAQAREDEPVAMTAYGLTVSVRPKGKTRAFWVRDRIEATRAALDQVPDQLGMPLDAPGL
jgi:hypothetical protein